MQDRKLHICIVTAAFPALTETFVTTKVLELHSRGHKITVIKNESASVVNRSHLQLIEESNIEISTLADISSITSLLKAILLNPLLFLQSFSFNSGRLKKNLKTKRQLALLQKSKYDIVHFEFSGLAIAYAGAIEKPKAKIVVSCRGTAEKVKLVSQPERALQLRKLFSRISAVHCVSADMAETILPYCNKQKIFINRPSVDVEIFKRKLSYKHSNLTIQILSIGRLTFQKGYLAGMLAIKQLKNYGVRFAWTIVGEGPLREEMLYHIHALGLTDVVHLAGKKTRDEILELYHSADIFFLPSIYEGIANVCLEAMAMELPVVATRSGGMDEVITHGIDGLLADVYDHHDMAKQLLSISYNADKRKKIGLSAREKVMQQFTLERQVNEFEEQYYKLVNDKPSWFEPQLQEVHHAKEELAAQGSKSKSVRRNGR